MKQPYKGIKSELYNALSDGKRPAKIVRFIAVSRWGRIEERNPSVICPGCRRSKHTAFLKNAKRYYCSQCRKVFSPLYSTMFSDTRMDLRKWVIFLMYKGDIPSVRNLMQDLQISNKSAQEMIKRYKTRTAEDDKLIHSIISQVENNINYWK